MSTAIPTLGAGILIGLFIGFLVGIYIGIYHRDKDLETLVQKVVAAIVGGTWLSMHAYLIITGAGSLGFFLDVVGSAAVGELIGLNLVQVFKQVRGNK